MSRADKRAENKEKPIFSGKHSGSGDKKSLKQRISEMQTWKKITLLVVLVLVLAALIVGIAVYSYMGSLVDEMHEPTPEDYDLSLVDVDGYINILLLGVDSRDMENIKGTRSDMIMIASINKDTYDVKLTSVYRDTYLKLGDTSTYDKITHACSYGGPEMTMKSLNQAMDINLSNYIVVNFKTVADVVDAVGGITVDVQDYEIQQLNKYTKQTANNIGREDFQLVSAAGEQTLEGVQAVSYGRIRKGVGDDFKRTERMRIVVMKVLDKVKTMSFSQIKEIIDMAVPQVQTNLKMNDILALGIRLPSYSISSGAGWPYQWTTGTINKVSYVFPNGMANNTLQFHQDVFGQEDYVPSATVNAISNEIIARITAARQNDELKGEKEGESKKDDIEENVSPDGEGDQTGSENPDIIDDPDDPNYNPDGTTVPTDPADPGSQTPATDPNQPTEPTVPTVPEQPTVPTEPSVPTEPPAQAGASDGGNAAAGSENTGQQGT